MGGDTTHLCVENEDTRGAVHQHRHHRLNGGDDVGGSDTILSGNGTSGGRGCGPADKDETASSSSPTFSSTTATAASQNTASYFGSPPQPPPPPLSNVNDCGNLPGGISLDGGATPLHSSCEGLFPHHQQKQQQQNRHHQHNSQNNYQSLPFCTNAISPSAKDGERGRMGGGGGGGAGTGELVKNATQPPSHAMLSPAGLLPGPAHPHSSSSMGISPTLTPCFIHPLGQLLNHVN